MTTLLMTAIYFASIAVWQITKIFQVAQLNKKVDDSRCHPVTTIGMVNSCSPFWCSST